MDDSTKFDIRLSLTRHTNLSANQISLSVIPVICMSDSGRIKLESGLQIDWYSLSNGVRRIDILDSCGFPIYYS